MKAGPATVGALVGAALGAALLLVPALYFSGGGLVLSTVLCSGGILLSGILFGAAFGATVVCAVRADRRNGGFRSRRKAT